MQDYTLASYDPSCDKTNSSEYKDKATDADDDSLVEQFFNNTTITVVSNVKRRSGVVLKLIWLVVTSIGVAIVTYQSHGLIKDFLDCKVKESKVYKEEQYIPFPSVTVCDLNPLNWTYLVDTNHSIYQDVNQFSEYESFNITNAVVTGFLKLENNQRKLLVDQLGVFMPTAKFPPDHELTRSSYHDPYMGQCVTFNNLFGEGLSILGKCHTFAMHIRIPVHLQDRIPNYHRQAVGYVLVHPRGTPPTFGIDNVVRIYPFDKINIKVEQSVVALVRDRECISCLDEEQRNTLKHESIFYEPGLREYTYNTRSCQATRVHKYQLEVNNCLDRFTFLGILSNDSIGNRSICAGNERVEINPPCIPPCEEIFLYSYPRRWSKLIDQTIMANIPNGYNYSTDASSWDDDEMDGEYNNSMDVVVKVYQMKGYEHITKTQTYSLWDLLGIIGGNVGLWLGISVLNLWEVIELGYMMASKKMKRYVRPTAAGPKHKVNNVARRKSTTTGHNYKIVPMQTKVTHVYHLQSPQPHQEFFHQKTTTTPTRKYLSAVSPDANEF